MKLHVWGTDFRRSSSEFRADLYLPLERRETALKELVALGFQDLVYLATCNRVEFYTTAPDYFRSTRPEWIRLLAYFNLGEEAFYQGYHLEGKSALRHLMRVGSSLESLVIGETQILGQLKDALKASAHYGVPIDPSLEKAFSLCFQTAKRVRAETCIGEKPVSVASLGLNHLQRLEDLHPLEKAVVVGRSPISLLIVQWLLKHRPTCRLVWVNRSLGALQAIPESAQTEVLSLDDFLKMPCDFSHLFTSTASPAPIFTSQFFQRLGKGNRVFFDFAQPSDIERSEAVILAGRLLHMEDFTAEAKDNATARESGVALAESMIDEALRVYCREQKEAPLLREFSAAESSIFEDLAASILTIEREFPEAVQPKLKKWAERLVKRNWHLSREHLKEVLQRVTQPSEQ
jgi:glutamyl-tRNA reductase